MAKPDPFDPRSLWPWTRYVGLLTLISGVVFLTVTELLPIPRTPRAIIGGFAILGLVVNGVLFLYNLATLVSVKLEGHNRTCFQVAVSFIVPTAFTFILASRVDAIPLETLSQMLTPWLLLPLVVFGSTGWFVGTHVDWNHPFRHFVIAATILFLLCWMWTMGMTPVPDPDGEGRGFFLDPERARRARETGQFVYRYILDGLALYAGLFLGFLKREAR